MSKHDLSSSIITGVAMHKSKLTCVKKAIAAGHSSCEEALFRARMKLAGASQRRNGLQISAVQAVQQRVYPLFERCSCHLDSTVVLGTRCSSAARAVSTTIARLPLSTLT